MRCAHSHMTMLEVATNRYKGLNKNVKIKLCFIPSSANVLLYLVFLSPQSTLLPSPSGCDYWLWPIIQHPVPFTLRGGRTGYCFTHPFFYSFISAPQTLCPHFFFTLCFYSCSSPLCPTAPASVTSRAARVCVALCQRRQLAERKRLKNIRWRREGNEKKGGREGE